MLGGLGSHIMTTLLAFSITISPSEKAIQKYIDAHSKSYDYSERWKTKKEASNFTQTPKQHTPTNNYLLFNFYDPESQNGSLAWWTNWKQLKTMKTIADIYEQLALLPAWGPKLAVKVAVVPFGCDVYIQSGYAKQQPMEQEKLSWLDGQGRQKFFMDFDTKWIIGKIPLQTIIPQNQQEAFVKTMQTHIQTQQILTANGIPLSIRQLQNTALPLLKKYPIVPSLLNHQLSKILEQTLELKLNQLETDLKVAEIYMISAKKSLIRSRFYIKKTTARQLLTTHLAYMYLMHDFHYLMAVYIQAKKFKDPLANYNEKNLCLKNLWQRLQILEQATVATRHLYLTKLGEKLSSIDKKADREYEENYVLFKDIENNYQQFKSSPLRQYLSRSNEAIK